MPNSWEIRGMSVKNSPSLWPSAAAEPPVAPTPADRGGDPDKHRDLPHRPMRYLLGQPSAARTGEKTSGEETP